MDLMKKSFVLCDSDRRYVERFMEYVRRKPNFPFQVLGYTSMDELEEFLKAGGAAMILVEESLWKERSEAVQEQLRSQAACLAFLTSRRSSGSEKEACIYKYQSMDGLLHEIYECYEETMGPEAEQADVDVNYLGFYSPTGRCYQTTSALVLGQLLAEREPVLYLSTEPFSGWLSPEEAPSSRSLSDLLYVRKATGGRGRKLLSLTRVMGKLTVINPVIHPEDLWELSGEELGQLIRDAGAGGEFRTVILDLSPWTDPLPALKLCRQIFHPVREDGHSQRRLQSFRDYVSRCGQEELLERCREIIVPEIMDREALRGEISPLRRQMLEEFWRKEWNL